MQVKYTLSVKSGCPVDGGGDIYLVEITSDTPIFVEDILSVTNRYKGLKMTQEDIAVDLSRKLLCSVMIAGYHSNVKTEVWA